MKRIVLVMAGCAIAAWLAAGCVRVYGTIKVVQAGGEDAPEPRAVLTAKKDQSKQAEAPKKEEPAERAEEKPAKREEVKKTAAAETKPAKEPVAKAERPAKRAGGRSITLPVDRDIKFTHHSSELAYNNGKSNRLRLVSVEKKSAELVAVDFDRAALKSFVEDHAGQSLEGKLVMPVREVQGGGAKVEVCALDSAVDWKEGGGDRKKAADGESCAAEAQAGKAKWKTPDGEEVETFRDLIYKDDAIRTLLNSKGVDVEAAGGDAEIPLDEALIRHMGSEKNCRGLVLFHRAADSKIDFFSRDQQGQKPRLDVWAK